MRCFTAEARTSTNPRRSWPGCRRTVLINVKASCCWSMALMVADTIGLIGTWSHHWLYNNPTKCIWREYTYARAWINQVNSRKYTHYLMTLLMACMLSVSVESMTRCRETIAAFMLCLSCRVLPTDDHCIYPRLRNFEPNSSVPTQCWL